MSSETRETGDLTALLALWLGVWPAALECWSPYIKLSEPLWCVSAPEEQREGLTGSFAMIRLLDHRVVISLRQIHEKRLDGFAREILAHEIGHHVLCPADLTDNARMLARLRAGLPTKEHLAPFIGNLYTDLLINDRLQRSAGLSMAGVYQHLGIQATDQLWALYMRTYELLWQLERGTLAAGSIDPRINCDAQLAARLIRSYARDWLDGAGRFAALFLPYLLQDEAAKAQGQHKPWNDTRDAGKGGMPDGLTEIDEGERSGAIHPSEDPDLSGIPGSLDEKEPDAAAAAPSTGNTGLKSMKTIRGPVEYADILRASGTLAPAELIVARYYRELAMRHLIPFPSRQIAQAADPLPEGLDTWDIGSPLEEVDWLGSVTSSPVIVPGITTRQRRYGDSPGYDPQVIPLDLYLGVDCSGSMGNPAQQLSYPVLSGAIMALSALRAGASVMVALSGEPGKTITTEGFLRHEATILATLTGYLGTGTTFGIHRLHPTFAPRTPAHRAVHILIITDNDIFSLLDKTVGGHLGWDVARNASAKARGGATYVLQLPRYLLAQGSAARTINSAESRMQSDGWQVAHVDTMEELIVFARRFSQSTYAPVSARRPPRAV